MVRLNDSEIRLQVKPVIILSHFIKSGKCSFEPMNHGMLENKLELTTDFLSKFSLNLIFVELKERKTY